MAWTAITRRKYRRDGLRYASDLTDAEWALIEPLLPPASPLGRPRETDLRSVMNAILYIGSTGCQWRQLPKEFPPYWGSKPEPPKIPSADQRGLSRARSMG